ncbi:hypothetical protein JIG36_29890 [Actinoplanes sp. LDG1-06]|uniref:WD40 repeat domain-containing protein n=1 Tax=Paractinoplanes ovalisporus TaxID=2810368 RepID=A0ABS2AIW7_9ACTN|nr:hypothetical protein [Actinoplanes ovalisporus]MBM2619728.1 hypothetical protein [Actinoplanes ovalisporus]
MALSVPGTIAFRSDARRLALGALNGDLTLWDTTSPARPRRFGRLRQGRNIVTATWNPAASDLLATASTDGLVVIWRLPADQPAERLAQWAGPARRPAHAGWAANGRHVFSVTADGYATAWEVQRGRLIGQAAVTGGHPVAGAHCRGREIVVVTRNGWARVWDPGRPPEPWIRLTDAPVSTCTWSDRFLLVAGEKGHVAFFDAGFRELRTLRVGRSGPRAIACTDDYLAALFPGGVTIAVDMRGELMWKTDFGLRNGGSIAVAEDLIAAGDSTRPLIGLIATGACVEAA